MIGSTDPNCAICLSLISTKILYADVEYEDDTNWRVYPEMIKNIWESPFPLSSVMEAQRPSITGENVRFQISFDEATGSDNGPYYFGVTEGHEAVSCDYSMWRSIDDTGIETLFEGEGVVEILFDHQDHYASDVSNTFTILCEVIDDDIPVSFTLENFS